MKIVIATPFYPPQTGVLAMYSTGLEKAFQKVGHAVHVVAFRGFLPPLVRHIDYFFRMLWALRGSSFVLSLDTWSVGVPAWAAAQLVRKKYLVRIGGDPLWEAYIERTHEHIFLSEFYTRDHTLSFKEKCMRKWLRTLTHTTHMLFFNSAFQKAIWGKAYEIPERQIRLLENYAPSERTTSASSARTFVAATRGAYFKNPGVLLEAFKKVQKKHTDITLDTRIVPLAEQQKRLHECYAVIIPSISEVSSNTAIEAVSVGKPFIISKDTGTSERLRGCGLFIDTRSEDELVRAIEQLLDPREYEKLQSAIRALVFSHSWDDIAREILATL